MNKKKIAALAASAVLIATASVFGTMAYLKSTDAVNNTFTVGKVAITLDEAKVDKTGAATQEDRVKENSYKLIPGHEYDKDPTVHFAAGSEAAYIFVKVEDGLADIEADPTIAKQIGDNGWTALDGVDGVYYKEVEATETDVDYVVFENFTVNGDVNNDTLATYAGANIKVTAYAIQKDGFATAAAAWENAE